MSEEIKKAFEIRDAFNISIRLWTQIADQPDTKMFDSEMRMKGFYLNRLNFSEMHNNCPFCDLTKKNNGHCCDCLLYHICDEELQDWLYGFNAGFGHIQVAANDVLEAIEKKYNEWLTSIGVE